MPKVSTFCPRCGEAIETEVPEEARAAGRAEVSCPACNTEFQIAPAQPTVRQAGAPEPAATSAAGAEQAGGFTPASDATRTPAEAPSPVQGSAGMPRAPMGPQPINFKTVAAGSMLIFVAVMSGFVGAQVLFTEIDIGAAIETMGGEGNLTGVVRSVNDTGIAGVTVQVIEAPEVFTGPYNITTAEDGAYAFDELPVGVYVLEFSKPNHTTIRYDVPIYSGEWADLLNNYAPLGEVVMSQGAGSETIDVTRQLEQAATVMGYASLLLATLALLGGIATLRKRWFPLAIVGAVAGMLSLGFLVGMFLSLVSLVLIIMARKDFRSGRKAA